jgi:uncharacterized protein
MAAADGADTAGTIGVQVAYAPAPHRIDLTELRLPAGASVLDALKASGLAARHGAEVIDGLVVGVWGKARALDTVLRDGDRVELLRPLIVDPKEARRQRYRRDGVKRAPR